MSNGRCRMHGGKSPGAPLGNKNALKHGYYEKEVIESRLKIRRLLNEAKLLLSDMK